MTKDQIKSIAEAYGKAKGNGKSKTVREYNYGLMLEMLHWLSVNGYCIVEKENVMKLYRDCENLMDAYPSMSNGLSNKLTTLEQLFGTSMFDQNEE